MAKQDGIIPLKGTIDNITFYKSGDGYVARKKGGISASRIATDPKFQRTRENGAEFGRAGSAGQLVRKTFRQIILNSADRKVVGRLTREMMKVVKADLLSDRGFRTAANGDPRLLEGFDFNANSTLASTFSIETEVNVNRLGGTLTISIPSYVSSKMVNAPQGATHYKLVSAGAAIDFATKKAVVEFQETADLAWDNTATAATDLVHHVPVASPNPLFVVFGIQFLQFSNGKLYPLQSGEFNSMSIIKVDKL